MFISLIVVLISGEIQKLKTQKLTCTIYYTLYTPVKVLRTCLLNICSVPGPIWALGTQESARTDTFPALRELQSKEEGDMIGIIALINGQF